MVPLGPIRSEDFTRQFNNEHGARADFNAGTVDLTIAVFEFQATMMEIKPGHFAPMMAILGAGVISQRQPLQEPWFGRQF